MSCRAKIPASTLHEKAVQALRGNPKMRTEFMNIVAAPIANKLFECSMTP
jgi:hypothetical protein